MGIGALSSAMSGMKGAQRRLDLASHNIANATTPGYQKQVLEQRAVGFDQVPGVFSNSASDPGGMLTTNVARRTDMGLYARVVQSQGDAGSASATAAQLRKLETVFPEPSENAIGGQFADFWAAWQGVSNQPSSTAARTALLAQTSSLISTIKTTANDIQTLRTGASEDLDVMVTGINQLAQELATAASAARAGDQSLSATQDLLSHRDDLAATLAGKVGGRVNIMKDGTFQFILGGRPLVDGPAVRALQYTAGSVSWAADGAPVEVGGAAAGLQAALTTTYSNYSQALDNVVAALVADVNSLHQTGHNLDGNTGVDFFDPNGVTASTLALDSAVIGQPTAVAAAGGAGAVEDGDIARQIAAISVSATGADSMYRDMIAQLGVETRLAGGRESSHATLAESLDMAMREISGVNIDEETVDIMAAQRAFQAAARVITAVDEMLQTLIERTGVVGR
jgi:flagellar hook-associated protein 1 FlgK